LELHKTPLLATFCEATSLNSVFGIVTVLPSLTAARWASIILASSQYLTIGVFLRDHCLGKDYVKEQEHHWRTLEKLHAEFQKKEDGLVICIVSARVCQGKGKKAIAMETSWERGREEGRWC